MENQHNSKYLTLLLIGLAVFIQQSSVIAGVNVSIADFITLLILVYLLFFRQPFIKGKSFFTVFHYFVYISYDYYALFTIF